jgi:hypothetical protein
LKRIDANELMLKPSEQADAALIKLAHSIPGTTLHDGGLLEGAEHGLDAFVAQSMGRPMAQGRGASVGAKSHLLVPDFALEYQRPAIQFTQDNLEAGVLNMDDMGLGKTIETIAALCAPPWNSYLKLVIVPARLVDQWAEEIRKWAGKFAEVSGVVVIPAPHKRKNKSFKVAANGWVVCSYDSSEEAMEVAGHKHAPYVMVVDEIHNLRGLKSNRPSKLTGLRSFAAGCVGLTGSPLYTDVARSYQALSIVQPGGFGSYTAYCKRYCGAKIGEWDNVELGPEPTNPFELKARLSYFGFRRERAQVADQLPFSAKYNVEWCVVEGINRVSGRGDAAWWDHLRAVAWAKNNTVVDAVENDRAARIPVLVFTYLVDHAGHLAGALRDSLLLTGQEGDGSSRKKKLDAYLIRCKETRKVPVLVGTMDAIGEGMNLQWAKSVRFAALDYSAEKVRQAITRAVRVGQTGVVPITFHCAKRTADAILIDEILKRLKESKAVLGDEKDKKQLAEALSPKAAMDKLREMWDRAEKEEKIK